jgi:hypothetical protein
MFGYPAAFAGPMREYVVVPPELPSDSDAIRLWTARALDYGASLPEKKKKSAARKRGSPERKKAPSRRQ